MKSYLLRNLTIMIDRFSKSQPLELIDDPDEKAKKEVENGRKQFSLAIDIVRHHVHDVERPFRLRPHHLLQLNAAALDGIHQMAGTYRNTPVSIEGSKHVPPEAFMVAEEVSLMCDHVNESWEEKSALYLSSYLMWRINWIHPFADGNGRTSRVVSYLVLSIKLNSVLPGSPTIPDQIAEDKKPYYDALEAADAVWAASQEIDVSALETIRDNHLARQLVNAAREAGQS